jgi:exodeoxyribonuclease VII small subunit
VSRKKTEPFEDALKKLEKIVEKLERGSLPLEEAMEAFAEGVRLVKYCSQKLDEAENRVQMLVKSGPEEWTTAAFEAPSATEQNRTSRAQEQPPASDDTEMT